MTRFEIQRAAIRIKTWQTDEVRRDSNGRHAYYQRKPICRHQELTGSDTQKIVAMRLAIAISTITIDTLSCDARCTLYNGAHVDHNAYFIF